MSYWAPYVVVLLLSTFLVEANILTSFIKKSIDNEKSEIKRQVEDAANKVRSHAEEAMASITNKVTDSVSWLDEQVEKEVSSLPGPCKADLPAVKNATRTSLWKCLQMARVVTDGTDITAKGFGMASDILETADNALLGITACIIGPEQQASQLVACYLAAIGTLASGIAQNIEEVERYVTVIKRDVDDIHAAIAECRSQTVVESFKSIHYEHVNCQMKN